MIKRFNKFKSNESIENDSSGNFESKVNQILEDLYNDIEVGGFKKADLKIYVDKICKIK